MSGEHPYWLAKGDPGTTEAVEEHFRRHVGAVDGVLHELLSDIIHIDVHVIPPSRARAHWTLFTTGLSDLPMHTPRGASEYARAELMVCLPAVWPVGTEACSKPEWYWPIEWLTKLARYAHAAETWLGWGHTIPNGHPPKPFARTTKLSGWMLLEAVSFGRQQAPRVRAPAGYDVHLYALVPLYRDEIDFKVRRGAEALFDRLEQAGVKDVIDLRRTSVVAKR